MTWLLVPFVVGVVILAVVFYRLRQKEHDRVSTRWLDELVRDRR